MKLDEEFDREQDLEELRRLARALHAQNQQLMEALTAKSREVERLRGKPGDLQLTIKMLEMIQAKAKASDEALAKAEAEQKKRKAEAPCQAKERGARTERGIRGPVVGRKNHYGSKSRRGTEVSATLHTVLETLKLHGKDPAAYRKRCAEPTLTVGAEPARPAATTR